MPVDVGIEAAMDGRHDDREAKPFDVSLDGRPAKPYGMVVRQAVEQQQRRESVLRPASALRQQDGHRGTQLKRLRIETALK